MIAVDMLILPIGCIACGFLTSASIMLRLLPSARRAVYAILPYKSIIGAVTAVAAVLSLLFPPVGLPIFGSFFPASVGILIGILLSIELLVKNRFFAGKKELFAQVGNALLYLKRPLGMLSILFGFCHLFFYKSPFF